MKRGKLNWPERAGATGISERQATQQRRDGRKNERREGVQSKGPKACGAYRVSVDGVCVCLEERQAVDVRAVQVWMGCMYNRSGYMYMGWANGGSGSGELSGSLWWWLRWGEGTECRRREEQGEWRSRTFPAP